MPAGRAEPPPGRALVPGHQDPHPHPHPHHDHQVPGQGARRVRSCARRLHRDHRQVLLGPFLPPVFFRICQVCEGAILGIFSTNLKLQSTCSPDNGALPDVPGPLRSCSPQTLERSGENADGLARGQRLLRSLQPRDAEAEELFV